MYVYIYVSKKGFPFFELFFVHLASKFEKSANKTLKNKFLKKSKRYQKTQNFTLISNPLEKCEKIYPKKVISKNVTEICTFPTFTHVFQLCFAYNFFWCIFKNLFNGFEISMKFCFFGTFFK